MKNQTLLNSLSSFRQMDLAATCQFNPQADYCLGSGFSTHYCL
jgi:hypothetical protein